MQINRPHPERNSLPNGYLIEIKAPHGAVGHQCGSLLAGHAPQPPHPSWRLSCRRGRPAASFCGLDCRRMGGGHSSHPTGLATQASETSLTASCTAHIRGHNAEKSASGRTCHGRIRRGVLGVHRVGRRRFLCSQRGATTGRRGLFDPKHAHRAELELACADGGRGRAGLRAAAFLAVVLRRLPPSARRIPALFGFAVGASASFYCSPTTPIVVGGSRPRSCRPREVMSVGQSPSRRDLWLHWLIYPGHSLPTRSEER